MVSSLYMGVFKPPRTPRLPHGVESLVRFEHYMAIAERLYHSGAIARAINAVESARLSAPSPALRRFAEQVIAFLSKQIVNPEADDVTGQGRTISGLYAALRQLAQGIVELNRGQSRGAITIQNQVPLLEIHARQARQMAWLPGDIKTALDELLGNVQRLAQLLRDQSFISLVNVPSGSSPLDGSRQRARALLATLGTHVARQAHALAAQLGRLRAGRSS